MPAFPWITEWVRTLPWIQTLCRCTTRNGKSEGLADGTTAVAVVDPVFVFIAQYYPVVPVCSKWRSRLADLVDDQHFLPRDGNHFHDRAGNDLGIRGQVV